MCVLGANTSHIQGLGALIVIPQMEPTVLIAVRNVDIQAQWPVTLKMDAMTVHLKLNAI